MLRPIRLMALVACLGSAACDGEGLLRVEPKIEVEPETIDFGVVPIGATKIAKVAARNPGSASLFIASLRSSGPFVASIETSTLASGAMAQISVRFTPTTADEAESGELVIVSNAANAPARTIRLAGRGGASALTVSPRRIELFGTPMGTLRRAEIIIENHGVAPAVGRVRTLGFGRPDHFELSLLSPFAGSAELTVDGRSSLGLDLDYRPFAVGADEGQILFEVCGQDCGFIVEVRASASLAHVILDPPEIDFGVVGLGETRTAQVVVRNAGTEPFQVTAVEARGAGELTVLPADALPATLSPNGALSVHVEYRPANTLPMEGRISVSTTDPTVPEAFVAVVGEGAGPLFVVQPSALHFGVVSDAGPHRRALLLLNAGSADVVVRSIGTAGDPEFAVTGLPGLPVRLAGGESAPLFAEFRPRALREYAGEVLVGTDDPAGSALSVPLQGARADRYCELELAPGQINFGLLPVDFSRQKTVRVSNLGSDPCTLRSGSFRAPVDPSLSLVGAAFPLVMEAGQEVELSFRFAPTEFREAKGNFTIVTDDLVYPERHLSLVGSSVGNVEVFAVPTAIDFGLVDPMCARRSATVSVFNAGTLEARLSAISLFTESNDLSLEVSPPAPRVLPAGGVLDFEVHYEPGAVGLDEAEAEIAVEDQPFPLIVPVRGEGVIDPLVIDEFEQDSARKVDVLFVVDNSCSMVDDQAALAENFSEFIDEANLRSLDFRIGVTTTDMFAHAGMLVGPVSTNRTSSLERVFANQVNVGPDGSGVEQGLEALSRAMSLGAAGADWNRDLFRADAAWVAVFVSDEDDQSPQSPVYYMSELDRRANHGYLTAAVTGGPTGCVTPAMAAFPASPAPRYEEFVALTAGLSESLCSSWSDTLSSIGNAAFGLRSEFRLSQAPDTGRPIRVIVNGQEVRADAVRYDGSRQSIVFLAPPAEGATIRIEYSPAC